MRASCLAFCRSRRREISPEKKRHRFQGVASKRPATANGCGGAEPSAASPLLPDARQHRLRRGSLHPTPRRSQRRSTPFFSSLLTMSSAIAETWGGFEESLGYVFRNRDLLARALTH